MSFLLPSGATLLYPWIMAIVPAFVLAQLIFFIRQGRHTASTQNIYFPSSSLLQSLPRSIRQTARTPFLFTTSLLAITLLSIAAARPQRTTVIDQPHRGRNIALVLDVSKSMDAEDFPTAYGKVTRMEGVKSVVAEYVRNRVQDRVALVVFGRTSYLQSPLTSDVRLVGDLVTDLQAGIAGAGTAIGDGMGLGLKLLQSAKEGTKAMILLTDGVNNSGTVTPIEAAKIAKDLKIPIHSIGIGVGTAPIGNWLVGGQAEIDEKTLQDIADTTGGVYFNAQSSDGLKQVYAEIDRLTEEDVKRPERTAAEELFPGYLAVAVILIATLFLLSQSYFRRIP